MTDHIAPQEAQDLLHGTIPGPWAAIHDLPYISIVLADDEDGIHAPVADITDGTDDPEVHPNHELMAAAPTLARALAGDTVEYRVDCKVVEGEDWKPYRYQWFDRQHAEEMMAETRERFPHWEDFRLVARRVSPEWEVTDEE